MIASHTITYQHADGRERTLTLYSNERIASGLAALVAAQHPGAVQSPPTRREASVPNDDLLSVEQAALEIGKSRRTVRLYITSGRLPAEWKAGIWLIRRSDFERLKENLPKMGRPKKA